MVKTILLFLCTCLSVNYCLGQEASVAAGGDATGSNGSVSFTVGQAVYTTADGDGEVIQGIQQAFEITTLKGEEFTNIKLELSAYPNPTTDFLTLKVENYGMKQLTYILVDLNGRLLQNGLINQTETQIDMRGYPVTTYLLSVTDYKKIAKTFKIIKN